MWLTSRIQSKAYFDKSTEMSANRSLGSSLWEQEKCNHNRRKILKSIILPQNRTGSAEYRCNYVVFRILQCRHFRCSRIAHGIISMFCPIISIGITKIQNYIVL